MQMFKERLIFKTALYELGDICKNHPSCASCYWSDYCDLLSEYGINAAVRRIKKKEKENGNE